MENTIIRGILVLVKHLHAIPACTCGQHSKECLVNFQTNGAVRPIVRKKAALCLLRLLRKAGPESDMLAPDVWSAKLVSNVFGTAQHECSAMHLWPVYYCVVRLHAI